MRNKKRIKNFENNKELVDKIIENYTSLPLDYFDVNRDEFFNYWKENYDQRLGQAVINFFGLPRDSYKPEFWFNECKEYENLH